MLHLIELPRVSAQERLAHEELLKYIVQLKINSARKHFEEEKGIESSYFSIQYLCQNALSHLSPVLSTTVDFHGFRITVYPLPYRPPLELQVDCLSSRVSEELYYINKHNISLLAINPDTNVTFLQIQDELFHCIHLHKVTKLFLLHAHTGSLPLFFRFTVYYNRVVPLIQLRHDIHIIFVPCP
jgi:hypothetical protein